MFSSSNNINPFPQIPSSSFHIAPLADAADAATAGFFPFHHQHDPLLAGYYIPAAAAGANYNIAPHHQVFHNLGVLGHHHDLIKKDNNNNQENVGGNEMGSKKGAPRKDRHSKISTSQGLRDRRVRLSIGISREFFDLQDMLGFDTASKTLEWLLGKSKKDIQELEDKIKIKIKNKNTMSSSSDHDQESNEDYEEGHVLPSEKKVKKSQKEAVARECRAKARERARERTKEKSCPHHNHQSNPNYHGLTQLAGSHHHSNNNNMASFLEPSSSNTQQLRQENTVKLMVNPAAEGSKGFVDWDISNAIRRPSTICTAANLSTELEMYGKP